ncbi:hypothetical protein LTR04_004561, partial [Oleoguttula sp. CCFEE 6159]
AAAGRPRSQGASRTLPLRRGYATSVADRGPGYGFQQERASTLKRARKAEDPVKRIDRKVAAVVRRDPHEGLRIDPDERRLRAELKYLKDPLKLADHVRQVLRENDEEKAHALVRLASKDMQCTVSWNHVIDWQMSRNKVNAALKTYNEMKKRAQSPDSYTYLLLIRGLANHSHFSQSLGKALSLHHSMSAPNSKVPPSTIHTNAVLQVCARSNDMDALWGVASKIPENGPGSADNLTYTTIINAIRHSALLETANVTEEQAVKRREKGVIEGRRIWEDIVGKWRQGSIFIDEGLVCSMGRLLLIGSRPRDWDDVLSLIEQTMNIPRLVPRLGTEARESSHIPKMRAPYTPEGLESDPASHEDDEFRPGGEFDTVKPATSSSRRFHGDSLAYATPSNNTLSLVLHSCLKMVTKKTASEYWNLLTDRHTYAIKPDQDNYHMYLRMLRQYRSSAQVVELLRNEMAQADFTLTKKTLRIAMSCCMRDKNNINVMVHANAIMDIMQNTLEDPDPTTTGIYLELALLSNDGRTIVGALERLENAMNNMKSMMSYGPASWKDLSDLGREEIVQLFKTVIGVYDRLLNKGEVPREQYSVYAGKRSRLAAFVTRWANKSPRKENSSDDGEEGGEKGDDKVGTRGVLFNPAASGSGTGRGRYMPPVRKARLRVDKRVERRVRIKTAKERKKEEVGNAEKARLVASASDEEDGFSPFAL